MPKLRVLNLNLRSNKLLPYGCISYLMLLLSSLKKNKLIKKINLDLSENNLSNS